MTERLTIARLGAAGDGIAETADGPVFVPGALPGETVMVERQGDRAQLLTVETASPDRAEPFCPYYGRCGGCSAQHMSTPLYAEWKRGIAAGAMRQAGLRTEALAPLVDAHGDGRRRVTLHLRDIDGEMRAGFMERRRHALVPIDRCPITVPALADAPAAAATLGDVLRTISKPLDAAVTASDAGLAIDLRGSGALSEPRRLRLIEAARRLDLARLSLHGEVLIEQRRPTVLVDGMRSGLPPGGFLQATAAGEEALAASVAAFCEGARQVVDLFAGIGPFSLRLARDTAVTAVEVDAAALRTLARTAREHPGRREIATEHRDLFRRPLLRGELEMFEVAILDPPRAGAEAQVRQLAASRIRRAVMVSCDPGTFARDAAILVASGFTLGRVTPVDQFKYGASLELLGEFERAAAPKKRPVSLRLR